MKLLIPIVMFILSIPMVLADSIFTNPLFDTVLLLIFAAIIFVIFRDQIKKIK